jgi:hypothetical protein
MFPHQDSINVFFTERQSHCPVQVDPSLQEASLQTLLPVLPSRSTLKSQENLIYLIVRKQR